MSEPPKADIAYRRFVLREAKQIAGLVTTPALVEQQCLQRRRVGRPEEDDRIARRAVDMLDPRTARYRDGVELIPVVALAVDDRMTFAAEGRQQQTGRLALRQGSFARPQHLRVKIDRAEDRTSR